MPTLEISVNANVIDKDSNGKISIRISKKENNGLSMNSSGKIVITKGKDGSPGIGGTTNIPGHCVDGVLNQGLDTIRFNKTVSRILSGDPLPDNEGVLMTGPDGIVQKIRSYTGG